MGHSASKSACCGRAVALAVGVPVAPPHFADQSHRHAGHVAALLPLADDVLQTLEQREKVADEVHRLPVPALPIKTRLERFGREIAIAYRIVAAVHAQPQCLHTLFAGTVGEAFGRDPTSHAFRNGIVPDRGGGLHAFLEVARLDPVLVLARPDSGVAIGLQLHAHLQPVGVLRVPLLGAGDLVGEAGQVLDMVPVFMRHDIQPREIAARAQIALHQVVEAGVDIDAAIARAVERPGSRRRAAAAARVHAAAVEVQERLLELDVRPLELGLPGLVERLEGIACLGRIFVLRADFLFAHVAIGIGALTAAGCLAHGVEHRDRLAQIGAEQQRDDPGEDQRPAAQLPRAAAGKAAAAATAKNFPFNS